MCALQHEFLANFKDLRFLRIRCICGTEILLDLANKETMTPTVCPGCRDSFGDAFQRGVRNLKDAFVEFERAEVSVGFRIPFNPPRPSPAEAE